MEQNKTVFDSNFMLNSTDLEFDYQKVLTSKLDETIKKFDQNRINEIVLWKVNRYVNLDYETLRLINEINPTTENLDERLTRRVIQGMLKTKGIKLAMAPTILRFKNPSIYQIIDQRVYRVIYDNQVLKLSTYMSEKNIVYQSDLYLKYLRDLKEICLKLDIPFEKADCILYEVDKRINKDIKLNNY